MGGQGVLEQVKSFQGSSRTRDNNKKGSFCLALLPFDMKQKLSTKLMSEFNVAKYLLRGSSPAIWKGLPTHKTDNGSVRVHHRLL